MEAPVRLHSWGIHGKFDSSESGSVACGSSSALQIAWSRFMSQPHTLRIMKTHRPAGEVLVSGSRPSAESNEGRPLWKLNPSLNWETTSLRRCRTCSDSTEQPIGQPNEINQYLRQRTKTSFPSWYFRNGETPFGCEIMLNNHQSRNHVSDQTKADEQFTGICSKEPRACTTVVNMTFKSTGTGALFLQCSSPSVTATVDRNDIS